MVFLQLPHDYSSVGFAAAAAAAAAADIRIVCRRRPKKGKSRLNRQVHVTPQKT